MFLPSRSKLSLNVILGKEVCFLLDSMVRGGLYWTCFFIQFFFLLHKIWWKFLYQYYLIIIWNNAEFTQYILKHQVITQWCNSCTSTHFQLLGKHRHYLMVLFPLLLGKLGKQGKYKYTYIKKYNQIHNITKIHCLLILKILSHPLSFYPWAALKSPPPEQTPNWLEWEEKHGGPFSRQGWL